MIHNQLHTVDLVIIGAYLIAMVMVGLVVVRKVKNMDDYYLGGRSFGPLVLMANRLRHYHRRQRPDGSAPALPIPVASKPL